MTSWPCITSPGSQWIPVSYWTTVTNPMLWDFRYCKKRCLNWGEPPWPLPPPQASCSPQTKRERQYPLGRDINLSFAPLMLPLIPKHPIIPGESYLFCMLPEALIWSLGRQLLVTSAFGWLEARGAVWGDVISVSLPNGASSFHSCFGDSQWVAASIVE